MGNVDPRWEHLSEIIVNHSLRLQEGEKVLIGMTEVDTFQFVQAIYEKVVSCGAFPQIIFSSSTLEGKLLRSKNEALINHYPDLEVFGMEWADAYIGIRGMRNPYEEFDAPVTAIIKRMKIRGTVSALRTTRTRWTLIRFPSEALAQVAQCPLDELIDAFFDASLLDWQREGARYQRLQSVFATHEAVHIRGRGTDLRFLTRGRKYLIEDGHINIPGGEIYTAPLEDSVEGVISFETPGVFAGARIEGICLEFQGGRVVKASAQTHEELLHAILAMDKGASYIGEFGVGTNVHLSRLFGDPLYDEKVSGTIHIALGRSYVETGGTNQSALHWDLVKDLRDGGELLLDGTPVYRDGQWLVDW